MRQTKVLSLLAVGLSLYEVIPWLWNTRNPTPIIGLLLLPLAFFLYTKSRRAFRIFRYYLWFIFLVSLAIVLTIFFGIDDGVAFSGIDDESAGLTMMHSFIWALASGAIIYYTDTYKVRAEYGLTERNKSRGKIA